MPAILKVIGVSLANLGAALITEAFLKKIIIIALEKLVKKTETDVDDKILQLAKEAWNEAEEK